MAELTVLVAARDEEERIGQTVRSLRAAFPEARILVADDGSRDHTAAEAEHAGARVLRLARRGKGQALTLAEREAPPGPLLLCDADLEGDLRALLGASNSLLLGNGHDQAGLASNSLLQADLSVARFARRRGGGFGVARRTAALLIRLRSGFVSGEPLSGQRLLSERAREAAFPLAAGFGAEVRMTIDVVRRGLSVHEVVVDLSHRSTGRDLPGFVHRGRQLRDILLAAGPLAVNHRGLRLPLTGWIVGVHEPLTAAIGLVDDLWSGPERGVRGHLAVRRTTGMLKLVAIPAYGAARTRSLSGGLLVALAANALNQLDTRPGRALKAYLTAATVLRAPRGLAVLLAPYDLREMAMLGDAGANALGAMLGLSSVKRFTGRGRWAAIGALAGLNLLGEVTSLGGLIERTPGIRAFDSLGRSA